MIIGSMSVSRVVERSYCRIADDYYMSMIGDYKIHANALMAHIEFAKARVIKRSIDSSIFVNDADTKLVFPNQIEVQNYLTTRYIGRAPLEFYGPKTKLGRQFILICTGGDPTYKFRYFGTEGAITGNNPNANELIEHPR